MDFSELLGNSDSDSGVSYPGGLGMLAVTSRSETGIKCSQ